MATGRGSLSIRCTGVQETIERQHRSWRLKTMEQEKGIWMLQLDVMSDASTILLNASFQCVHKTVLFRHHKKGETKPMSLLSYCLHYALCCMLLSVFKLHFVNSVYFSQCICQPLLKLSNNEVGIACIYLANSTISKRILNRFERFLNEILVMMQQFHKLDFLLYFTGKNKTKQHTPERHIV